MGRQGKIVHFAAPFTQRNQLNTQQNSRIENKVLDKKVHFARLGNRSMLCTLPRRSVEDGLLFVPANSTTSHRLQRAVVHRL